ncbi:hypothetical protein [Novipirellula artificiosorum]|uniref:Uncharacterized protein n=1 Tax=Novipirellula artificiosorum TaxID=2528016 RepID=A0A5C6DD17_9BACT|nr:hypothetical protein [Novipirellula artificiosorum]TWU35133.1 hypothetical protein Poly41_42770 [Novipirellula artificiosorum]
MIKKLVLSAAVVVASLAIGSEAKADHGCYGPRYSSSYHSSYRAGLYGHGVHPSGYRSGYRVPVHHSYRGHSSYRGYGYGSPYVAPYRSYYGGSFGYPGYGRSGISFSIGF